MNISIHPAIQELKKEVNIAFNSKLVTPKDFLCLSVDVFQKTGRNISISSIKRLWGYVDYVNKPSINTLDTLSEYIGERDFNSFCNSIKASDIIVSEFFNLPKVEAKLLNDGTLLEIGWNPNRVLVLEYRLNGVFYVKEAENSKIKEGDLLNVSTFYYGKPLVIENVVRDGAVLGDFVAGKEEGLSLLNII